MKGCLKELERLVEYHSKDKDAYSIGLVDGLKMAIDILKNKDWYEVKEEWKNSTIEMPD